MVELGRGVNAPQAAKTPLFPTGLAGDESDPICSLAPLSPHEHPAAISQIEQHNTAIGLNSRSNAKEKDRKQLKEIYERFTEGKSSEELHQIVDRFE